jgi:hypothetical protein
MNEHNYVGLGFFDQNTGPGGYQMTMLLVLVYTNPNCTAAALKRKKRASRYHGGIIPSYL